MKDITLVGLDIAKNVFQLHCVDENGVMVRKERLHREKLLKYMGTKLPQTRIVMEACAGAHHWAREFAKFGHKVQLISPQYVKPFVKTNKNDAADAKAITTAARDADMNYVPVKDASSQTIQAIHRAREQCIEDRTRAVNRVRALLVEFGITIPLGISHVRNQLIRKLDDAGDTLPDEIHEIARRAYQVISDLDQSVGHYDKKIKAIYKSNEICQKIGKIEGVGPITATILLTVIGDGSLFKNGRHFAAYLGLVPRQYSSGNKQKLYGISKRGDRYIRSLLVHGGRAVVRCLGEKKDKRSRWARQLQDRRGYNRTAVAIANKNARIIWSVVSKDTEYKIAV